VDAPEWTEEEHQLATIVRPDLELTYLIDLDRNVYVEQSMAPTESVAEELDGETIERIFPESGRGSTIERVRIGTDIVDGHPCAVYRSRIEMISGETMETTVWEAEDLGGLALRSETRSGLDSGVITELRDLQIPADASLFELPSGARRVEALDAP
jgi:hypothetical protein